MESYKGGLKGFWKRRGYHRSDGGVAPRRRRLDTVELGGGGERIPRRSRRARLLRIKIHPRIAFLRLRRAASPRRILSRIRDAYVRMMLGLSSAIPRGISNDGEGFGMQPMVKERDEKVFVETYKALIASSATTASVAALAMPW
ncbi:uncharacterized protein LOC141825749 [Curcuma longa]|uniref:uncharacterized protein LOC141825749 n=1 Tax=Curcuma longa TaxID=136217 RepID=UPI003D9E0DDB